MFGSKFHPLRIMSGAAGMDIYNGGGGKGGGSAPKTPDYTAAAQATAQGNLDLAKYTTQANRINQITPYGTLTYTNKPTIDQSGYDAALSAYQNQLNAYNNALKSNTYQSRPKVATAFFSPSFLSKNLPAAPVAPNIADYTREDNWTATQELSPEQQAILEANQALSQSKLGYAQDIMGKAAAGGGGVDVSTLPSYGINPGESYSDAIMRRLQPTMQAQQEAFDAKMANQGVMPGTQAYDAAYRNFSQAQNDQLTSAVVGGMQTGLAANQQAYQQALQNMNQPVNMINALQGGSQVTSPSFVNAYNMQTPAGADILGATQAGYAGQLGAYNAQQAAQGNFMGGLMGLGGSILGGPIGGAIGNVIGGLF